MSAGRQDEFNIFAPSTRPTWARRAFVLTLPISAPLYVVGLVVGASIAMVLAVVAHAVFALVDLWDERS